MHFPSGNDAEVAIFPELPGLVDNAPQSFFQAVIYPIFIPWATIHYHNILPNFLQKKTAFRRELDPCVRFVVPGPVSRKWFLSGVQLTLFKESGEFIKYHLHETLVLSKLY